MRQMEPITIGKIAPVVVRTQHSCLSAATAPFAAGYAAFPNAPQFPSLEAERDVGLQLHGTLWKRLLNR